MTSLQVRAFFENAMQQASRPMWPVVVRSPSFMKQMGMNPLAFSADNGS